MTRPAGRRRAEEGAAVVLALGMVAVLLTVAFVSAGLVALVATHRRVQAAADLAALAGAEVAQRSGSDPCGATQRISEANKTAVRACVVANQEVAVVVEADARIGAFTWTLVARARAGPAAAG